jgi:HK97 family phage prohead protease
MEHTVKAATVTATTELGEFTAIAAAYTLDRDGDRIVHGAFAKTIEKWRGSGKRIPLHWNHSGAASDIIGSIDPGTLREEQGVGLKAGGRLDLNDSDTAKEAWRAMKSGSMSLSFGYLVPQGKSRKAADGATELLELDLFEISIVPAPANPDTRILSMKSADQVAQLTQELQEVNARLEILEKRVEDQENTAEVTDRGSKGRSVDPLREQADAVALEVATGGMRLQPTQKATRPDPEPELVDLDELKRRTREATLQALSGGIEER